MHSVQILCVVLLASCATVRSMGGGMMGGMGGGMMGGGMMGGMGMMMPKPYGFGYQAPDPMTGSSHFRQEQGDASGNVQGSYGYTDAQGLFRKVDYVANAGGFHASVKTNEPGTKDHHTMESPADVSLMAQPAPPGVQAKYSMGGMGGMGGGYGGMMGGGGGMMGGGGGMFAGIPRSFMGKSGY